MCWVEIKFVQEDSKVKKSKKFVLAALALLATTGLLALAGCKTEVDTNQFTSAAKRKGY